MASRDFQRIEALFSAASALPVNQRSEFLRDACRGDVGLLAEVESLLRAADSGDNVLDGSPLSSLAERPNTLKAGDRLGNFQILAMIGRGGMGEVWKARDLRLDRTVAIKTANEKFTDRFEREARAIAALNHPNICTLHDVGPNYLVMELVDGETLAARLRRGKPSLDQTIEYAAQIASALAAAHAKGIIHRDLKPGNVMVTKAGVKVLDFGLAKSAQDETLTMANAVMGTPGYMAPEQREGKACDARTDIYALGLVLLEMATGARAQPGERAQFDSLPERLAHIVKGCLAPDPDNRLQSAQDVKLELEWIRDAGLEPSEPEGAIPTARWHRALPWVLFGATALGFAAFAWVHETGMESTGRAEPLRFQIALPKTPALRPTGALALSPDGRQLAFIATSADGIPRIWIRALNSLEVRPLPGTESAGSLLFWKPDSRFIAFDSGKELKKIDISGGAAEAVCGLNLTGIGGSWSADGVIVFGQFGGPIMRVSAAGGVATPVTVLDSAHGDIAHTEPRFLPDGRHFIYLRDLAGDAGIWAGSLDVKPGEQDSRRLVQADLGGTYAPSSKPGFGYLLFLRGHTLMAQPFDARHLKISGDPVRVVEEPLAEYWDAGALSVSANGTLAYWPGSMESQLTWFNAQGQIVGTVGSPSPYLSLALSRDGTRALVSKSDPGSIHSLWLVDMSRGTSARVELDPLKDGMSGVWAADGRGIIFGSTRSGHLSDIFEKQMGGAADPEALITSNEDKYPLSVSPDGHFLLYVRVGGVPSNKLWVLPLQGGRKPVPLLRTESDAPDARFSPDGRWVAYVSNESGRLEVYGRAFSPDALGQGISNLGVPQRISEKGGSSPVWREDVKELYFIDQDSKLMAVTLSAGSAFQAGAPKVLFQAPPGAWAPSPYGTRFLFLVPETQEAAPFTIVLNWQAGLKK
ncbi:MAG: protein kinase [Bryobacteraceae bacterium]